jgi:hypothetical protein
MLVGFSTTVRVTFSCGVSSLPFPSRIDVAPHSLKGIQFDYALDPNIVHRPAWVILRDDQGSRGMQSCV